MPDEIPTWLGVAITLLLLAGAVTADILLADGLPLLTIGFLIGCAAGELVAALRRLLRP